MEKFKETNKEEEKWGNMLSITCPLAVSDFWWSLCLLMFATILSIMAHSYGRRTVFPVCTYCVFVWPDVSEKMQIMSNVCSDDYACQKRFFIWIISYKNVNDESHSPIPPRGLNFSACSKMSGWREKGKITNNKQSGLWSLYCSETQRLQTFNLKVN